MGGRWIHELVGDGATGGGLAGAERLCHDYPVRGVAGKNRPVKDDDSHGRANRRMGECGLAWWFGLSDWVVRVGGGSGGWWFGWVCASDGAVMGGGMGGGRPVRVSATSGGAAVTPYHTLAFRPL